MAILRNPGDSMTSPSMFLSENRELAIRRLCERFRERIPVPTEELYIDTEFGKTHALVAGPKRARPLVVLHGALVSSAHVLPELGPLLSSRRVYALDVIGQSVWSEDRRLDLTGDSYGHWVSDSCAALKLETYDLCGVSWAASLPLKRLQSRQSTWRT